MSEIQATEWKCGQCWQINEIKNKKCYKCGTDIPKDYIQYQNNIQKQAPSSNNTEQNEQQKEQNIQEKIENLEISQNKENTENKNSSNQNINKTQSEKLTQDTQNEQVNQQQEQQDLNQNLNPNPDTDSNINNINDNDQQNDEPINPEAKENQDQEQNQNQEEQLSQEEQKQFEEFNAANAVQKEKNLEKALEYKTKGAEQFKNQEWDEAIDYYEEAIDLCPLEEKKTLSILYSNVAICQQKLKEFELVIENCTKSIEIDPEYRKPYLNRAIAYENTQREEDALEDLQTVLKLTPDDKQLQIQIFRLQKKVEEIQEKRKTEVISGLKDIGNSLLGKFGLSLDNFKLNQQANGGYNINFQK